MKLDDVLLKECVVAGAKLCDKAAALREITRLAKESPSLRSVEEQEITAGLQECELPGAENFSKSTAILNCDLKSATDFVAGLITVPSGVDFDGRDWRTVNLIIFIIGPEGSSNKYDRLFSAISRALHTPGVVEEMFGESTSEALRESFLFNVHNKKHWAVFCFMVIALFYTFYKIGFFRFVRPIF